MLPINTHASARDTVKSDDISANSRQGNEAATDESYQDILSSLKQEQTSAPSEEKSEQNQQARLADSDTSQAQTASETADGNILEPQTVIPQPALSADKTQQQVSVKTADNQLTDEEAARRAVAHTNTVELTGLDADISTLADSEVKTGQTQQQLQTSQAQLTAENKLSAASAKVETQTMPEAATGQLSQNLAQAATGDATAAALTGTGKQAEQASQASSQAVSLIYRQQELHSTGKLSSDQMQLMTEQSGMLGNKGLANSTSMLNKLDGVPSSVLQGQAIADNRGMAEFSTATSRVEGLASTSGQPQTYTLATDTTLAERSQTANGKYEWSMLKLDSQKQNWSRQLFNTLQDRIEMQANQQIKQAKIRLDPPELGRLELMVRIEGDRMSVSVNASNAAVREALQETNDRLRQELENQFGSSVDVNVGSDSSDQAFKNEEEMVAVTNVEATEINQSSVPLTTGWLNALA
ncbi:flagellar hook-length control protein FliK [Thalassomonas actiniarum]|uniref:Flagellar hook-length control protein FliK n=1 Tax=Thalassomonas actiniarum TaxID=485447 RepID=A0AAF0C3W8_9GAMM|nr:flagellar hook-length control protein FliK [Thalassomonas actiniarum]WDD99308.1 flagellar hook-length control protein FliK [Thalassomonas actiniarum]